MAAIREDLAMDIKGHNIWDVSKTSTAKTEDKSVPQKLADSARFKNMLLMMQQDGLISTDAAVSAAGLSDAQKNQLREQFNIEDMAAYADKRALLNELVGLGVLGAEESELSMLQMLPPRQSQGGVVVQTGSGLMPSLAMGAEAETLMEEMLAEPNYLTYLEKAIQLDGLYDRSDDVKDARVKLYDLLKDIYT
ncbi:hypothetical protein LJB76_01405 [Clostridia bacterium OttesenSCG-928-O13]|nr:hypothetical protein [Clostridia bacterium OttesenSCG-928-O13]